MNANQPQNNNDTIKKIGIFCWSIVGLLLIISLVAYLIYLIKLAIIPLLIAIAVAYLLTPLVLLLQRKMRKIFAVIITYVLFLGIIFNIFFFLIPLVVDQFKVFMDNFPAYLANLTQIINDFLTDSPFIQNIENFLGTEFIPRDTTAITQYFLNRLDLSQIDLLQQATAFTRNIINWVVNFIIGPILGFYVLKDTNRLRSLFVKILPVKFRPQAVAILDKINMVAGRYIRGQILISFIVGFLCTIALLILRVDFAILLGVIAGILNLVPFLGPVLGAIPAALTALLISPWKALLVVILFIVIQQIDNYFITPNIMKYQVRVHPAIIIVSLIAGGALFGFWGLLLAVPFVAIVQEILKYYLMEKRNIAP
ncbi:MAG: AI-2E family transporter [Actinomycetota bacterium]|nr:AI-2E family transporter [Actinomycetota bacterium]